MEERPFTDLSYEQFLNEEKIMGCRCKKCQALYLPPRPICIKCFGDKMEWVEIFDRNNPYCSGVVELEEKVRIDARIEGFDTSKPETIKVGTPVTVQFLHRGEGENMRTFPAFKPV